jgi:hypothetical protein
MFMEHMHATGEATWCDWCFNEEEMRVSLMPNQLELPGYQR